MTRHFYYLLIIFCCGCAANKTAVLYSPPSQLPNVTIQMKTAGFWISQQSNPDEVVLSADGIDAFNKKLINKKLIEDLPKWPRQVNAQELKRWLQKIIDDTKSRSLMLLNGDKVPPVFWVNIKNQTNFDNIPNIIKRQYGLISKYADQRVLPTADGLYAAVGDIDFDELQNSAFDIGTPVVVLHESKDGNWLYVQSTSSGGWVLKENVQLVSDEEMNQWLTSEFIVITEPKADIFNNEALTQFRGYVQMGTRLPINRQLENTVEVLLPCEKYCKEPFVVGFISSKQVSEGYLTYTPRHILEQAFKMVHEPYGWGGMYGEQDCSRFVQQVFSTVGISLPRNSKEQRRSGDILVEWNKEKPAQKIATLAEFKASPLLLGMNGHIMIYLGNINGNPYAIHEVWAYRKPGRKGDDIFVLNRVTVSDLSIGEGSKKGSLAKRLVNVSIIK